MMGHSEICNFLVEECKADVFLKDNCGNSALDYGYDSKSLRAIPKKALIKKRRAYAESGFQSTNSHCETIKSPPIQDRFLSELFYMSLSTESCGEVHRTTEAKRPIRRVCAACHRKKSNCLACPRCSKVWYCHSKCQNADWSIHKRFCIAFHEPNLCNRNNGENCSSSSFSEEVDRLAVQCNQKCTLSVDLNKNSCSLASSKDRVPVNQDQSLPVNLDHKKNSQALKSMALKAS